MTLHIKTAAVTQRYRVVKQTASFTDPSPRVKRYLSYLISNWD